MGQKNTADGRRLRSSRLLIAALLATSSMTTASFVAQNAAYAQSAGRQTTFNIAPGSLSNALAAFGRQAGLQVTYVPDVASGKRSPGVSGTIAPSAALARLLQGSGLTYQFTNATTVAISRQGTASAVGSAPDGAIPLDTIDVQGQPNQATTEGTNSYGTQFATVGKDGAPLKETPQSVSVVTRKRLDDQNLTTLDQAIANTTGMVVQQGDADRPGYFSRGFFVNNVQFDGVPTNVSVTTSAPDLAMYDRVEVLRGPAGLLSGMGSTGGTFNLVRKMPLSEFHISNTLSAGSYNSFRNQFDITGPINDSLRARVVATLQSQNFIEDNAYQRIGQIYGVLEKDLSDSTTLRIGAYYQRRPARLAWSGVPATTDYKFVTAPRSTFFGAPWNENIYTQTGAFAQLEHKFDNGWSMKANLNYLRYQSDVTTTNFNSQIDAATLTGNFTANDGRQDDQQLGLDWYATGPVNLFGREHKFTFGVNASHEDLGILNFYGPLPNIFYSQIRNVFDLNIPKPAFNGPTVGWHTYTNQYSAYANARIKLADPLTLVLGGRLLWWDSKYRPNEGQNFPNFKPTNDRINAKPIPFAGLVYDLNSTYSIYGSYATMFVPQTQRNKDGRLLDPVEGEQFEVGVKGSYLDGRVNATFALYSLTEKNRALLDTTDPSLTTYFAQGKARSQGVEIEVSGRVTYSWNIFAGYTYTDVKSLDASTNLYGGAFTTIAPKHLVKLWSTYNLPGALDRWTVGGGILASSSFYSEDSGGRLTAPSYVTASASLNYRFNDQISASLNVDNIFDRTYIRSLVGTTNGYYGTPRTFTFKLQSTW